MDEGGTEYTVMAENAACRNIPPCQLLPVMYVQPVFNGADKYLVCRPIWLELADILPCQDVAPW